MIFSFVLDFGTGTMTIKYEDYDRIVMIATNMTALVTKTVISFCVNAVDIMHLRNRPFYRLIAVWRCYDQTLSNPSKLQGIRHLIG